MIENARERKRQKTIIDNINDYTGNKTPTWEKILLGINPETTK